MKSEYDIFNKYLEDIHIFDYEEVPINKDLFILGADDFNKIIPIWIEYISGNHEEHPNNYIDYKHGFCKYTPNEIIDSFIMINNFDRFHGISKKIRKEDFDFCFQYFSCGEKPFIIVKQEWVDALKNDTYSIYGMIDIVGIKNYLEKNGIISKDIIKQFKSRIDQIAIEYPTYSFITFTDNIFIKSNWVSTTLGYKQQYNPEHFIKIIKLLQDVILDTIKLKSYAIITQGVQLFQDDDSLNDHSVNNHFFIGSIATPFIELFDIDESIKAKKRSNPDFLKSLYLSEAFLLSLKLNNSEIKRREVGTSCGYLYNKSGVCMDRFFAIDIDEIIKIIKI